MAVVSTQAKNSQENPLAGFGPNEWIVEDMYQRYLADPNSVDPAWHDFFKDYRPMSGDGATPTPTSPAAAPAAAVKTAPAAAPATATKPAVPATPDVKVEAAPVLPKAVAKPSTATAGTTATGPKVAPLRGVAAKIVENMDASLAVPTATSVRS